MRRLASAARSAGRDEHGAVAVIVAICFPVFIGFAVITIDIGGLYVERRELQKGADAAALAVAQDCALSPTGYACTEAGAHPMAEFYGNENAKDGAMTVPGPGVGVRILHDEQKVLVRTETNDPSSSDPSLLRHFFAPLFLNTDGSAVSAKSTAMWGSASLSGGYADVPVSGSVCDFMGVYGGGTTTIEALNLKAASLKTVAELSAEMGGTITGGQIITLHQTTIPEDATGCTVSPGFSTDGGDGASDPSTMPAGFGYLADNGACGVIVLETLLDGSYWAAQEPGASPSAARCIRAAVGTAVNVPIFIEVDRPGKRYLLYAPAAFYITGAKVVGGGPAAVPTGFMCPGGALEWCIRGHWVRKLASAGPISIDGPSFGVDAVGLTWDEG